MTACERGSSRQGTSLSRKRGFDWRRTEDVFDKLDEEFGAKPKSVYTYKELSEMFEATVKLPPGTALAEGMTVADLAAKREHDVTLTLDVTGTLVDSSMFGAAGFNDTPM